MYIAVYVIELDVTTGLGFSNRIICLTTKINQTCKRCNLAGHDHISCKAPLETIRCSVCGVGGHYSLECPMVTQTR